MSNIEIGLFIERLYTFPDPKNPVIIVAGIRLSGGILVVKSESSLWGAAVVEEAAETVNLRRKLEVGLEKPRATIREWNERVDLRDKDWWSFKKRGSTAVRILERGVWLREVKERKVEATSSDIEAIGVWRLAAFVDWGRGQEAGVSEGFRYF